MKFYLGIHNPAWLPRLTVPVFVSYSTLRRRQTFPRSAVPWCHDSRGFTEIGQHGRYTFTAKQYASDVRRAAQEIGRMEWASIMDWMCEDAALARTGLTVIEHQRRTLASLLELRELAPDVHWVPVLQGRASGDYLDHAEMYDRAGIDLHKEDVVGVGSVCRRQSTQEILNVTRRLLPLDLRLHGFGVKATGISIAGEHFASFDSQAGSRVARMSLPMPEHRESIDDREFVRGRPVRKKPAPFPEELDVSSVMHQSWPGWTGYGHTNIPVIWRGRKGWVSWSSTEGPYFSAHRNCANCLEYFMQWRDEVVMPRLNDARRRREWNQTLAA